jgi:hypothetical protein
LTLEVYAHTDWYAERSEAEEEWKGVLRRCDPPGGPAARAALTFCLLTGGRQLNVYAAHLDELLTPLEGLRVKARGKLVDLSAEGHGEELWLASIEPEDR